MSVIEVRDLAKSYGRQRAVQSVSFEVRRGEIFGILGPNGAGKTTTVECIAGLRNRDAGTILVLGADPQADRESIRRSVGVQLQHGELPEKLRVGEALDLFASFYPESDPVGRGELVEVLGLGPILNRSWGVLSGGQKQRLQIALALIGGPTIAILDELTTGLDPGARRETWDLIEGVRDRGATILLVTHFMQEAEQLCDRLAVINDGRVVALDTPAGIVAGIDAGQRMRFRPLGGLDERLLTDLPEVIDLVRVGEQWQLSGTADLVWAVTSVLARNGVVAQQLRVEQPSLDDAFIAMTRSPEEEDHS